MASAFADSDRSGIALLDLFGRLARRVEVGVERVPYMVPIDLRLSPEGDLLVLDPEALYRFSPEGRYLGLVAGDFDGAGGLAVDGYGNVYVAEKGSSSSRGRAWIRSRPDGGQVRRRRRRSSRGFPRLPWRPRPRRPLSPPPLWPLGGP